MPATLTELAANFASHDGVDATPEYEKSLRNLAARYAIPPVETRGKAFVYDRVGAFSLRVAQAALAFGLDRVAISQITLWLGSTYPTFPAKPGVQPSNAHEIIRRTDDGEAVTFALVMGVDRSFRVEASWAKSSDRATRAAADAGKAHAKEMSRYVVLASEMARSIPAFED